MIFSSHQLDRRVGALSSGEWSSVNLLAIDSADAEHAQLVADFLAEPEEAGQLVYETGRS